MKRKQKKTTSAKSTAPSSAARSSTDTFKLHDSTHPSLRLPVEVLSRVIDFVCVQDNTVPVEAPRPSGRLDSRSPHESKTMLVLQRTSHMLYELVTPLIYKKIAFDRRKLQLFFRRFAELTPEEHTRLLLSLEKGLTSFDGVDDASSPYRRAKGVLTLVKHICLTDMRYLHAHTNVFRDLVGPPGVWGRILFPNAHSTGIGPLSYNDTPGWSADTIQAFLMCAAPKNLCFDRPHFYHLPEMLHCIEHLRGYRLFIHDFPLELLNSLFFHATEVHMSATSKHFSCTNDPLRSPHRNESTLRLDAMQEARDMTQVIWHGGLLARIKAKSEPISITFGSPYRRHYARENPEEKFEGDFIAEIREAMRSLLEAKVQAVEPWRWSNTVGGSSSASSIPEGDLSGDQTSIQAPTLEEQRARVKEQVDRVKILRYNDPGVLCPGCNQYIR